jgi:hypothetical protein
MPLPNLRRRAAFIVKASASEILHPELPRVSGAAIADAIAAGDTTWRVLDVREPEVCVPHRL